MGPNRLHCSNLPGDPSAANYGAHFAKSKGKELESYSYVGNNLEKKQSKKSSEESWWHSWKVS